MEIKTTTDIHDDYELPECPDKHIREMLDKNIPADGTICRKCKWDKRCNKKWVAIDELISQLEDWNNIEGLNLYEVINKLHT